MDSVSQDIRIAVRMFCKNPTFSLIVVLTLALGIGANTAIFSILDAVMLKYLPVKNPEELVQVTVERNAWVTSPIWEALRDHQDVFSGVFAYSSEQFNIAPGGRADYVNGLWASADFFSTLGVSAVIGRTITAADDIRGGGSQGPVAVLSYSFWQGRYGGDPNIVGQSISLNGRPFPIIGVTPPGFFGFDVGRSFDVAVPLGTEPILRNEDSRLDHRSFWWLRVIGRPRTGMSFPQAVARLEGLSPRVFEATVPQSWRAEERLKYLQNRLQGRPAGNGLSSIRTQYGDAIVLLMGIVGIVLLIACTNVANLLLARATARRKEFAVRLSVGAGRGRLIRQLLTESMLLSSLGAALGVLFARWGARMLVSSLSSWRQEVFLDLDLNPRILGFTVVAAMLTGLLCGLAPACRATSLAPHAGLKEDRHGLTAGRAGNRLGMMLVVAQVALSLALLVGAGLLLRSFRNLLTLDAGFESSHVLMAEVDIRRAQYPKAQRAALFEEILDRLRAIPGVHSASQCYIAPISGSNWTDDIRIDDNAGKPAAGSSVHFNRVSPGYFQTMGTSVLAGRDFGLQDRMGSPYVAIVNETLAKNYFGGGNPIGKHFDTDGAFTGKQALEIVGVVRDAKYRSLRADIPPTAYLPISQDPQGASMSPETASFQLRAAGSPDSLVPGVQHSMGAINKDISIEFRLFSTQIKDSLIQERLLALMSAFFGALALVLTTMGLYGLMAYIVARRRNEIGIRMALGARQKSVWWMILRQVGLLMATGEALGLLATYAATRLLASMLYGLKPEDPVTIATAVFVLAAVAGFAGYIPARRAARLDPMVALREN